MKILVVDNDLDILELIKMMIEGILNAEIITAGSGYEAINLMGEHPDLSLVMSDFKMDNGGAAEIYYHLRQVNPTIPMGIVSSYGPSEDQVFDRFYEDHPHNFYLAKPFNLDDIEQKLKAVFRSSEQKLHNEFVRLSPEILIRNEVPYQTYIGLSESKFVMILEKDSFDLEILNNYIHRGVEEFYLKRGDFERFIVDSLRSTHSALKEDTAGIVVFEALEEVQLCMSRLGVNEETIVYAEAVIENSMQSFKNYSKLCDLLDRLSTVNNYVQKHAYLCSYPSVAIAKHNPQFGPRDFKKLVMASLFKDICLAETPELARIFYAKDKRFANLSQAERHRVMVHAQDACYILESIPEFDSITREIVLVHHERPKGTGFPRGKEVKNLNILSPYFMLACQFAHDMLDGNLTLSEITQKAQNYAYEYDTGLYRQVYEHFISTFNKLNT